MIRWKNNEGEQVYWFNSSNYKKNLSRINTWKIRTFQDYHNEVNYWENWYVCPHNEAIKEYNNKFTTEVPENSTLYFTKASKFPRTKLNISTYKRTIKTDKCDFIVVNEPAKIKFLKEEFCVFTDIRSTYIISLEDLKNCFNNDLNKLKSSRDIGCSFNQDLQIIYIGKLTLISDLFETVKLFLEGTYNKPFIIDQTLDNIINKYLPNPTLEDIKVIYEMICSSDSNTIKLGALMASGFNISKYPLTFRLLLGLNVNWSKTENGGNAVVLKQMLHTLKFERAWYGGIWYVASTLQKLDEKYTEEDIALAQDFARTLPQVKQFVESNRSSFYLDTVPFVPDEYKK